MRLRIIIEIETESSRKVANKRALDMAMREYGSKLKYVASELSDADEVLSHDGLVSTEAV